MRLKQFWEEKNKLAVYIKSEEESKVFCIKSSALGAT